MVLNRNIKYNNILKFHPSYMGELKIHIGSITFKELVGENYLYADKSLLIKEIQESGSIAFSVSFWKKKCHVISCYSTILCAYHHDNGLMDDSNDSHYRSDNAMGTAILLESMKVNVWKT